MPVTPEGIYLLTEQHADDAPVIEMIELALAAGVRWFQYRDKSGDAGRRERQALAILHCCRAHAARLIINDDIELARRIGADGVHLGEHDGDPERARAVLGPGAVIGVSCYNDLARARALATRADYLAFGAVSASGSKPGARHCPLSVLGEARQLGRPIVAIGGIDATNAAAVLAAGADAIAVIGAVWRAADPAQALAALMLAQADSRSVRAA